MNKPKLVGLTGEPMTKPMPKITGVKPTGSQILVEVLTEQELLNTNLFVGNTTNAKVTPQAYVLAAGPTAAKEMENWGFKVGDRVMFSTNLAVMAPKFDDGDRDRFLIEPHAIRAVLTEA